MTATRRATRRSPHETGTWDPLVRPIAVAMLAMLLALDSSGISVINGVRLPNTVPLLLGFAGIALALVIPRPEPIIVPVASSLLVIMLVASVWWSHDPFVANLWLRTSGVVMLGAVALGLVLPNRDVVAAFKLFVGLVLSVTVVAVAIDPLARIHIDPLGEAPDLAGWHGWFIHKNTMAGFLVVALPTAMAFYRHRTTRCLAYLAITVLIVGSDSTTGRSALAMQVAVRIWFAVNRRLTSRGSATFAVSTTALVLVAGAAVVSSLAAIADAAGKDLTFTGRTQIWAAVIDKIGDAPLLGHGVKGIFGVPNTVETALVIRQIGFPAGHAHNGLLDVALQLGLVGVVIALAQVVRLIRSSLGEMRRSLSVPMFGLTLIAGICVMSVGESSLLDASVAVVFCSQAMMLRTARANRRASGLRRSNSAAVG